MKRVWSKKAGRLAARAAPASLLGVLALGPSCRFDPSYRDFPEPTAIVCTDGVVECRGAALVRCDANAIVVLDDCGARGEACAPQFMKCTPCLPGDVTCEGANVLECDADGQKRSQKETCDGDRGYACRSGMCTQLCDEATRKKSNIGCEYWPVDLDNAVTTQGNAALQQFAVIVSNPQPDLAARVTIEEDVAKPGEPANVRVVGTASVGIRRLEIFKLGPKEVDGSEPDKPNGGTHTALTRGAFRIRSDVPIVAYQFNPLENVNVFSNEASLLLPTAALGAEGRAYVVAGWPQTIARSEDPDTNFGTDLRAFLSIVGTKPDTKVHLKTTARIVPGGPFPNGVAKGAEVDAVLQPFEVLNLETGDFNADFTGSVIDTTGPIAVYVGSEASDAPFFSTLAARACCADHLEEQVTPLRAVGKSYVLGHMPSRSRALAAAGAVIQPFPEPELFRVVAAAGGPTVVTTTLPAPWNTFTLDGEGANVTIPSVRDFVLNADKPVIVADVQVSQEAAGVPRSLPGGDPSLTFVPPAEQWRNDYILLTPDKYAFDFLVITAPFGASVYLDGLPIDGKVCETAPGDGLDEKTRGTKDPPFTVYRCQLSFPVVDPGQTAPNNVAPGRQNDGVHRVQSDLPIGVVVYGFDSFVSYAYAGGTELVDINAR
ncbi:MAG: IgGFc-binding protein [Labilithrix sp.]|nr:IgGFc-binding protein [Labilithrix sp.]